MPTPTPPASPAVTPDLEPPLGGGQLLSHAESLVLYSLPRGAMFGAWLAGETELDRETSDWVMAQVGRQRVGNLPTYLRRRVLSALSARGYTNA